MKGIVCREDVYKMVFFLILINLTPCFDSLSVFYLIDILKFNDIDLSDICTIGAIFYVSGLLLYYYVFQNLNPRSLFLSTNFLFLMANSSFLLVAFGYI